MRLQKQVVDWISELFGRVRLSVVGTWERREGGGYECPNISEGRVRAVGEGAEDTCGGDKEAA